MPRAALSTITAWITEESVRHPTALAARVAERLGVTQRTARRTLVRLVALQWLRSTGTPRRPRHEPGTLRQVVRRYALAGLDEHHPWVADFAPCLDVRPPVARLVQQAFGELLNNAIDHSGGQTVTVSLRQTATHVQLLVSDDGCGLFTRVREAFGIAEPAHALLELGKGRLSSQPQRHTGHGLFLTARLADVIDLHADGAAFQRRSWQGGRWHDRPGLPGAGTSIFVGIALDTPRRLDTVWRNHADAASGHTIDRTHVPLHLLAGPATALASRAQARLAAQRLADFRCAELDFDGVDEVGPAFADELFRVFARAHPGVELVPLNASAQVRALIDGVRSTAA